MNAQNSDEANKELTFGSGCGFFSSFDELLNYYQYKGVIAFPLYLKSQFRYNKNNYGIHIQYSRSEIEPENINALFYDYNSIDYSRFFLMFNYNREVCTLYNKLFLQLGVTSYLDFVFQTEKYKSRLAESGKGIRKSRFFSVLNLSPEINFLYCFNDKNRFSCSSYYTLFSYIARPDDDYVKQLNKESENYDWHIYSAERIKTGQLMFVYNRSISHDLSIDLEYIQQITHYLNIDEFWYTNRMILLGITKTF